VPQSRTVAFLQRHQWPGLSRASTLSEPEAQLAPRRFAIVRSMAVRESLPRSNRPDSASASAQATARPHGPNSSRQSGHTRDENGAGRCAGGRIGSATCDCSGHCPNTELSGRRRETHLGFRTDGRVHRRSHWCGVPVEGGRSLAARSHRILPANTDVLSIWGTSERNVYLQTSVGVYHGTPP
jgi:hypothetical protein